MYIRYLDGVTATEHNKVFYGRQLRQENFRIINHSKWSCLEIIMQDEITM